jgi:hypothetical protein
LLLKSIASEEDFNRMAKNASLTPDELKNRILQALQNDQNALANTIAAPVISDLQAVGNCNAQSFEISLFKIIGVKGTLTLCGDSPSNWSAELKMTLIVAGADVWSTSYQFDPHNLGVCFEPNVALAKARLCFNLQLHDNKVCLNIKGNACVWAIYWQCGDFDTTVFCIPLP